MSMKIDYEKKLICHPHKIRISEILTSIVHPIWSTFCFNLQKKLLILKLIYCFTAQNSLPEHEHSITHFFFCPPWESKGYYSMTISHKHEMQDHLKKIKHINNLLELISLIFNQYINLLTREHYNLTVLAKYGELQHIVIHPAYPPETWQIISFGFKEIILVTLYRSITKGYYQHQYFLTEIDIKEVSVIGQIFSPR